jgi:hypothetical protein
MFLGKLMKIINLFVCTYLFFNSNSYATRNNLEERNQVQSCTCGHKAIHSYDKDFSLGYEVTLTNPQNNEEFYWSEVANSERYSIRPLLCKGCLELILFIDNYEKEINSSDEDNSDDMDEEVSYDLKNKDYFVDKTYIEKNVLKESFVYIND